MLLLPIPTTVDELLEVQNVVINHLKNMIEENYSPLKIIFMSECDISFLDDRIRRKNNTQDIYACFLDYFMSIIVISLR